MIRKNILFATLALFLIYVTLFVSAQSNVGQNHEIKLKVNIEKKLDFNYTDKNLPLTIIFENNGDEPLRILSAFEPKSRLRAFFTVEIKDLNDAVVWKTRRSKIDMPADAFKYFELKGGERYELQVDLADLFPDKLKLNSDVYKINVTYHNQYGDNCFKGQIKIDPILLNIN